MALYIYDTCHAVRGPATRSAKRPQDCDSRLGSCLATTTSILRSGRSPSQMYDPAWEDRSQLEVTYRDYLKFRIGRKLSGDPSLPLLASGCDIPLLGAAPVLRYASRQETYSRCPDFTQLALLCNAVVLCTGTNCTVNSLHVCCARTGAVTYVFVHTARYA